VYIILSTLDFTVAFAGISLIGAEHVQRVTEAIKGFVHDHVSSKPAEPGRDEMDLINGGHASGSEGLYAMIVLAYTVHKTLFLPVRVGLTAWVTPRLVRWLRTKGWAGGAGTRRAAEEIRDRLRKGGR
jgi:N-terminal acetyltransferase 2